MSNLLRSTFSKTSTLPRLIVILAATCLVSIAVPTNAYACGDSPGAYACEQVWEQGLPQLRVLIEQLEDAEIACNVAQQGLICQWMEYYGFSVANISACQTKKIGCGADKAANICGGITNAVYQEQANVHQVALAALAEPAILAKAKTAASFEAATVASDQNTKVAAAKQAVAKDELADVHLFSDSCSIINNAVTVCVDVNTIIGEINDYKLKLENAYLACLANIKLMPVEKAKLAQAVPQAQPKAIPLDPNNYSYSSMTSSMMDSILDLGNIITSDTSANIDDLMAGIAICNPIIENQIIADICLDCNKLSADFMTALGLGCPANQVLCNGSCQPGGVQCVPLLAQQPVPAAPVAKAAAPAAAVTMAAAANVAAAAPAATAAAAAPASAMVVAAAAAAAQPPAAAQSPGKLPAASTCCQGSDVLDTSGDANNGMCEQQGACLKTALSQAGTCPITYYAPDASYCSAAVAPTAGCSAALIALNELTACPNVYAISQALYNSLCSCNDGAACAINGDTCTPGTAAPVNPSQPSAPAVPVRAMAAAAPVAILAPAAQTCTCGSGPAVPVMRQALAQEDAAVLEPAAPNSPTSAASLTWNCSVSAPAVCSIGCNPGDTLDTTSGDTDANGNSVEGMCVNMPTSTCGAGAKCLPPAPVYYTPIFNNCQGCEDCLSTCQAAFSDCPTSIGCYEACSKSVGTACMLPACRAAAAAEAAAK